MRLGITGPRGTLARYIIEQANDCDDIKIITLDRNQHENTLRGCHMVIHAAAYTNVAKSYDDRQQCWDDNVELTRRVFNVCKTHNIHLILISTLAVENVFFSLTDQVVNINSHWSMYAQTKLIAELVLALDAQYSKWTICRTDSLFGKNIFGVDQKFVGKMIDCIKNNKKPTLNKIDGLRPTYAKDAAAFLLNKLVLVPNSSAFYRKYVQLTNDGNAVSLVDYYNLIDQTFNKGLLLNGYTINDTTEYPLNATMLTNNNKTLLRNWKDALEDYIKSEY